MKLLDNSCSNPSLLCYLIGHYFLFSCEKDNEKLNFSNGAVNPEIQKSKEWLHKMLLQDEVLPSS